MAARDETRRVPSRGGTAPAQAEIDLEENQRLGSLGVSLAAGVITPAIKKISPHVGSELSALATAAARANPVMAGRMADPITLATSTYHPLPDHSALGLSAFYVALLTILSGFPRRRARELLHRRCARLRHQRDRSALEAEAPRGDQPPPDVSHQVGDSGGRRAPAHGHEAITLDSLRCARYCELLGAPSSLLLRTNSSHSCSRARDACLARPVQRPHDRWH
jgi:hypothetical protein